MILQVTFKCVKEEAEKLISGCGIKMTNEPRCIESNINESRWVVYCSKGSVLRWRYVLHVGRIMNSLTKEVYYEGIHKTIDKYKKDESTVH